MKKTLLSFFLAFVAVISANAQTEFVWGTATWNIQDGRVFDSAEELNADGIILSYSNPNDYTITPLSPVTVEYDLYIDGAEEPITLGAAAERGTCNVHFTYEYAEGHSYKIITKSAILAQINIATFSADTLSINNDSYSISFKIMGPELVMTMEVEAYQSLAILNQDYTITSSIVDVKSIYDALGINSIEECQIYGLNGNGSYNTLYGPNGYDGWRDADGEYTNWGGGWDAGHGHNAYPAVYCIKLTENADSVLYYFYDYWSEYNPDESGEIGGGSVVTNAKRLAPETVYNSMIWDWENEDGTITKYNRRWRCEEGKDYKASFAFIANKKYVVLTATMHFISIEDYEKKMAGEQSKTYHGILAMGTGMSADPFAFIAEGTAEQSITIANGENEGEAIISFEGFTLPMPPMPIPAFEAPVQKTVNADGSINYCGEFRVQSGMVGYNAVLSGAQESASADPVIVVTLQNATTTTAVFATNEEVAKAALKAAPTAIAATKTTAVPTTIYSINGQRQSSAVKGINIMRLSDGSVKKIMK